MGEHSVVAKGMKSGIQKFLGRVRRTQDRIKVLDPTYPARESAEIKEYDDMEEHQFGGEWTPTETMEKINIARKKLIKGELTALADKMEPTDR